MHESDADYISPADLTQETSPFFSEASIEMDPKDKDHPFSMISNEILRSQSLSIDCGHLIMYLLSMARMWKISIPQVVKHYKGLMCKERVYVAVREAIEAGYMMCIKTRRGNLISYVYRLADTPKFKKCFRYPELRDTGAQDPENRDTKNTNIDKKTIEKNIYEPPSPSAQSLTHFFFEKLKELNPNMKPSTPKTRVAWDTVMHRLQKVDGYTEPEVRMVINYIVEADKVSKTDFMYTKTVLNPKSFGNQFRKLHFAASMKKQDTKADQEIQASNTKKENYILAQKFVKQLIIPPEISININEDNFTLRNDKTWTYETLRYDNDQFELKLRKILQREKLI